MSNCIPIPPEVVTEILSWLPVKSLLRFRCVSKAWFRLLTVDAHFIKLHLHRSSLIPPNIMAIRFIPNIRVVPEFGQILNRELKFYSAEYDSCDKAVELKLPFKEDTRNSYYSVGGSCNGLFCLTSCNNSRVHLWNPLTGYHITIPCPPTPYPYIFTTSSNFGFGFDQTNNEYKVVRIQNSRSDSDSGSHVDVYTLGTALWRSLEVIPQRVTSFQSSYALVNGSLHWIATRPGPLSSCWNLIVSFNMRDEAFQQLLQPYDVRTTKISPNDLIVGGLDGSLCLSCHHPKEEVEIWVMKEYGVEDSWTKQFKIRRPVVGGFLCYLQPLGIVKNGDIILKKNTQHVILYDPKSNLIKKLISFSFLSYKIYGYLGSLVSPRVNHGANHNNEEAKFEELGVKRKRADVVSREEL